MWEHVPIPFCTSIDTWRCEILTRDEHWTGHGLGWTRTIVTFDKFGLDPDCKSLQNLGTRQDLDWVNGKKMSHFKKYFGLHLDLDFTFEKNFGLWLDLDWVLKNQDFSGSQNLTVRSSLISTVTFRVGFRTIGAPGWRSQRRHHVQSTVVRPLWKTLAFMMTQQVNSPVCTDLNRFSYIYTELSD